MLAAAVAARDASVQQALINATHKQAWDGGSPRQFPLIYGARTGDEIMGMSSPRQGAVYAPLLVKQVYSEWLRLHIVYS